MATVYSLVCFGGVTGKVVTISNASPAVVSLPYHGLLDGTGVIFSTSGALPTGITAGTTYYSRSTATDTFNLYDTVANAIVGGATGRINTSSAGSGTHIAKSAAMAELIALYPSRWGFLGSERIFDSLLTWRNARFSEAGAYDSEVCEIGEAFDDYISGSVQLNIPCASTLILPEVNGIKTTAWHQGKIGFGYKLRCTSDYTDFLQFFAFRTTVQDIGLYPVRYWGNQVAMYGTGAFNTLQRCIISAPGSSAVGIYIGAAANSVLNNLVVGCGRGIFVRGYEGYGDLIANNTLANNWDGFYGDSNFHGWVYNNVCVGSGSANWTAPFGAQGAGYNAGISTDQPWYTGTDTSIKTATATNTTFLDYAGNDFRPASATSAIVDAGSVVVGVLAEDIRLAERPNYNNGMTENWDIGCYEYDHGLIRPASTTVTFVGVHAGSEIRVFNSSGIELAGVESSTDDPSLTWTLPVGDVSIVIVANAYELIDFTYTSVAEAVTLPIQQSPDRWYLNP